MTGTPSKEKQAWAAKFALDPSCSWLTAEQTHAVGFKERHSSEVVLLTRDMLAGPHFAQFSGARQIDMQQRRFGLDEAFDSIFGCSGRGSSAGR